ncbi:transcription elongation factor B polypeptide 3-like isoform X2 [Hyalella azteca]|uniref:Transcription elongation factor B polypeptide 3-like isoform X2 n=1 Tax=Hyalella azteca TaxID=294128 RepID=A0A8B7P8C4_HYAAZ|nr:transcription elongation factor B polypeptide 3-like isoform X2 [Hyalella azteca]
MDETLKNVLLYQRKVEKYAQNRDTDKLVYYLSKLKHLPIKVPHLEQTGVGRSVNSLRHFEGSVGERARSLVGVWKKMVAAESPDEEDEDDERLQIEVDEDANGYTGEISAISNNMKSSLLPDEDISPRHLCNLAPENDYDPSRPHAILPQSNGDSSKYQAGTFCEPSLSDSDHGQGKYNPLTSMQDYGKVGAVAVSKPTYEPTPANPYASEDDNEDLPSIEIPSSAHKKSKHKHTRSKEKKHKSHSKEKSSRSKHHKSKSSDSEKDRSHKDKRKEDGKSSSKRSREAEGTESMIEESLDRRRSKVPKLVADDPSYDNSSLVNSSDVSPDNNTLDCNIVYNGYDSLPDLKSVKESKQRSTSGSRHNHHSKHSSSSKDRKKSEKRSGKDHSPSTSSAAPKEKKLHSDEGFAAALLGVQSEQSTSTNKKSKEFPDKKESKKDKNHKSKSSHKDKKKKLSSDTDLQASSPSVSPPRNSGAASSSYQVNKAATSPQAATPAPVAAAAALPALAAINPNYRPLPRVPLPDVLDDDIDEYPMNDQPSDSHYSAEEYARGVMSSKKTSRRPVYSGKSSGLSEVPTLFDIATRCLQENIDSIEFTGGVPFDVIRPVVERATAKQLFNLEHYNPYLLESTNQIWEQHCKKDFKNRKPEEMETYRDMYIRLMDEREQKFKALSEQLTHKKASAIAQRRTTQLAFVGTVAKPPKNVARAQAKFGTATLVSSANQSKSDEIKARKTAMANAQRAERSGGAGANARPGASKKPKAPLMAKTMQDYRKTFRR